MNTKTWPNYDKLYQSIKKKNPYHLKFHLTTPTSIDHFREYWRGQLKPILRLKPRVVFDCPTLLQSINNGVI